jgi:D-alanine-D-alanine ligase
LKQSEFGKVAVMLGGTSAEREVSLKSGAAVLAALQGAGVDAHAFDPREQPLSQLQTDQFDRVFIALHGRGGEDGALQGALELMKMPYTGSGVLASALAMDKWRTKLVWQASGIPVPEYALFDSADATSTSAARFAEVEARLGLPLFVKPACEGSSIGISKVKQAGALAAAHAEAARHDQLVIAERFIDAGEYTIALLERNGRFEALPMIQIIPAGEYYDYQAKYLSDDTRYQCPCELPTERQRELGELAVKAFAALGGRGWGRVDLMLDRQGQPWFLEVNTAPGMTDHSLVPMAARAAGIDFTTLVLSVLKGARVG